MNRDDTDLLIVPDVHGRTFWREAVETYAELPVIFLGDYVDPYYSENIDNQKAYNNFKEIIAYKKQHEEKTILLLGNHDMHYMSEEYCNRAQSSRYSYMMSEYYAELFNDHRSLFQLAYETAFQGRACLFTHAGVTAPWMRDHEALVHEPFVDSLNALLDDNEGIQALATVGRSRGGWAQAGSILWADLSEMDREVALPQYYQIFGHTQQVEDPIITPTYACLDCRRAFLLSEVLLKSED